MRERILIVLSEIKPEFDFENNLDINYIEEGVLDSFDIVNLVDTLDREFGISIDGEDIIPENFSNLVAIENLLITKK